ncbi:MAG: hypothetical protein Kow0037_30690 [Calditrichia bacterium]
MNKHVFVVLTTAWNEKYRIVKFDDQGNMLKQSSFIKIPNSYSSAFLRSNEELVYLQDNAYAVILNNDLNILDMISISRKEKLSLYLDKNY